MADHPFIVELAKELERFSDKIDGAPEPPPPPSPWEHLHEETREFYLAQARAAYAFVLKDLMQPSEAKLVVNEVLRARAREIGVEIAP